MPASPTPLMFDPNRPAPLLAGGSLLLALAARVPDCEHARTDDPRLAPAECPRCHRTWALLECVLGGFSLFSPERDWVREGVPPALLVQLEAIAGGDASLRELATFLGLSFPGAAPVPPSPASIPHVTA